MKITKVVVRGLDGWFVGRIVEFPGVLTQGRTIEEPKANLSDALALFLDDRDEEI